MVAFLDVSTTGYDHIHVRNHIPTGTAKPLDGSNYTVPLQNLSKHHVLPIQVGGGPGSDVELRLIAVRPRVGHAEHTRPEVTQLHTLILKFAPFCLKNALVVSPLEPSLHHGVQLGLVRLVRGKGRVGVPLSPACTNKPEYGAGVGAGVGAGIGPP